MGSNGGKYHVGLKEGAGAWLAACRTPGQRTWREQRADGHRNGPIDEREMYAKSVGELIQFSTDPCGPPCCRERSLPSQASEALAPPSLPRDRVRRFRLPTPRLPRPTHLPREIPPTCRRPHSAARARGLQGPVEKRWVPPACASDAAAASMDTCSAVRPLLHTSTRVGH